MADGIRATPYSSSFAGTANDLIGGLLGYMRDPRRTQQMQGLAGLLESTGIPKTVERLAYGEPLTNLQQANVPTLRPETAEALMTLLPVPSGASRAARAIDPVVQKYGPRLEQSLLPAFEAAYNRGGLTREMVEAMGTGVQSNIISPSEAMKVIGGTKILSDDGLPQMVYRGASSKYDPLTNNISEASKSADTGMWFSGSAPVANTYSGKLGHVSPAYLDMKTPLVVDAKGGMWHDIPTKQLEDLMNVHVPKATVSSDFIARLAKSRGYDGVHFKNMIDPKMDVFDDPRSMNPSDVFVNFNPQSVYSAISDKRIAPTSLLDYRGSHTAPGPDFGAPLHDLTGGGQMYPADVYSSKAAQFYGAGEAYDQKAFNIAQSFKDKPNSMVTIYRAVPKDLSNSEKLATLENQMAAYMKRGTLPKDAENYSSGSKWYDWAYEQREKLRDLPDEPTNQFGINEGDWVTLTKEYAKNHGESALKGQYKILSKKVKAKDLWTNADSIHEFGYHPQ